MSACKRPARWLQQRRQRAGRQGKDLLARELFEAITYVSHQCNLHVAPALCSRAGAFTFCCLRSSQVWTRYTTAWKHITAWSHGYVSKLPSETIPW
jgi:hypothetical protein